MYKECRNISGKVVCSLAETFIDRIEKVEEVCSKVEFTARELFNAFDIDGDGVITRADLEKLAEDVFPLIKRLLEIEQDRISGFLR